MQVRDKILVMLDSWQQAFGGPEGKYPHYYWAYDELRVSNLPQNLLNITFSVTFHRISCDKFPSTVY